MSQETILIDVGADGSIKVEASGFKGAGCEAVTKAFRDALGETVDNARRPEFYQAASAPAVAKQSAGGGK